MQIRTASLKDISALVSMINSAYRATEGVQGWTHEATLLDGVRTDSEHLRELFERVDSVILLAVDEQKILGSVHLEKHDAVLYFGMLAVDPKLQSKGIGRFLVQAAKDHAFSLGCDRIRLTVISVRTELIEWYERHGFVQAGEVTPFPEGNRFGNTRQPLQLLAMEYPVR